MLSADRRPARGESAFHSITTRRCPKARSSRIKSILGMSYTTARIGNWQFFLLIATAPTLENVKHFKYFGNIITMMKDIRTKLNPGLPWRKQHSTKRRIFLTSKVGLNLRKKPVECYSWTTALYGAETWTFGKWIRNTWKFFKCGAGENWSRSANRTWQKWRSINSTYSKNRNVLHTLKIRKAKWIFHILPSF